MLRSWTRSLIFFSFLVALAAYTIYTTDTVSQPLSKIFTRATQLTRPFFTTQPRLGSSMSTPMPSAGFKGLPVIPPNDPSLNAQNPAPRRIAKVFEAIEQAEGAGARVRRSVGTAQLRNFTPFLMLVCLTLPLTIDRRHVY